MDAGLVVTVVVWVVWMVVWIVDIRRLRRALAEARAARDRWLASDGAARRQMVRLLEERNALARQEAALRVALRRGTPQ